MVVRNPPYLAATESHPCCYLQKIGGAYGNDSSLFLNFGRVELGDSICPARCGVLTCESPFLLLMLLFSLQMCS